MKKLLFTIQSYISLFLFGISCSNCRKPGNAICSNCLSSIKYSDETEHLGIYGLYDYGNKIVSHAVWSLKYHHKDQAAKILTLKASDLITEIISDYLQTTKNQKIILVPIPQHKNKTQTRGFNQAEVIALWVSQIIPDSKIEKVLEKTRQTLPQSHISNKTNRIKNINGVMKTNQKLDSHKVYIVIDDVTTTGATFLEARRALKAVGAQNILCIALAHGYKSK
jgi:ComF family protein